MASASDDGELIARAIAALELSGRTLVTSTGASDIPGTVSLSDWLSVSATNAVDEAVSRIDLDTIGKILLT